MTKGNLLKLLLLFTLTFFVTPTFSQSAHDVYREGLNQMKVGSYKKAIEYFNAAIQIGSGNKEITNNCNAKIRECRRKLNPTPVQPRPVVRVRRMDSLEYNNKLYAFKDSVVLNPNGTGMQLKIIPVSGKWDYSYPEEARQWLSVSKDDKAYEPTLTICGRRNPTDKIRRAVVTVKGTTYNGMEFKESFEVVQEKGVTASSRDNYNDYKVILSLQFDSKGGKQVVKMPRDTKVEIPENVLWCFKSEFKDKEGKGKIGKAWLNVTKKLVKALGGLPKTEYCNENEFVIETTPNTTGNVRSTNVYIPGKGSINVSQDK